MFHLRLGVLLFATLLPSAALFAQQNGNDPASAPQPVKVEAPSVNNIRPDSTPQPVDPRVYEIGVNDVLRIEVWRDQDLTRPVNVRPDGKFSMPLIGDVQAEGLTPDRLKAQITQALSEQMNSPDVTVSVIQVNSKTYRVSGWVNRPGTYPLITPIRIYEALMDAGGFRDQYANKKKIRIIRGTQRLTFNAKDYEDGKNEDGNIFIQNGDIIAVDD